MYCNISGARCMWPLAAYDIGHAARLGPQAAAPWSRTLLHSYNELRSQTTSGVSHSMLSIKYARQYCSFYDNAAPSVAAHIRYGRTSCLLHILQLAHVQTCLQHRQSKRMVVCRGWVDRHMGPLSRMQAGVPPELVQPLGAWQSSTCHQPLGTDSWIIL